MRVGMLSMDYPPRMAGGTTVHTYQMARHFAKLGHPPVVVAAGHPDAPKREEGDVRVRRVGRPYSLFSAFAAGKLRAEVDAFHGHGTCAYGFMKMYTFPTVVKMHNTWLEERRRYRAMGQGTGMMGWYVRMDRYCATRAGAVICISDVIARETMKYGVPEERITVIHNGIDPAPFRRAVSCRKELGLAEGPVIGYVGRLAPHKGVVALARAFRELARKHRDVQLLVVGDGPERADMEDILRPVKKRVRFTGYVPHDSVPDHYATADVMAYPTSYEPLGNVVLESMAAGRPLVASRTGGIPEIFDKRCGVMIEPPGESDSQELVDALEGLVSSDDERKNMGAAGKKAVKKYSWTKVCEKTVEVMEGVLRK